MVAQVALQRRQPQEVVALLGAAPAVIGLAAGGYVLANQPLDVARWHRLPEPPGVPAGRYFLYRVE